MRQQLPRDPRVQREQDAAQHPAVIQPPAAGWSTQRGSTGNNGSIWHKIHQRPPMAHLVSFSQTSSTIASPPLSPMIILLGVLKDVSVSRIVHRAAAWWRSLPSTGMVAILIAVPPRTYLFIVVGYATRPAVRSRTDEPERPRGDLIIRGFEPRQSPAATGDHTADEYSNASDTERPPRTSSSARPAPTTLTDRVGTSSHRGGQGSNLRSSTQEGNKQDALVVHAQVPDRTAFLLPLSPSSVAVAMTEA